jgi:hypothetical protein
MPAKPVEAVLVVYYGPAAHRATYGRLDASTTHTKDYIQLSKRRDFLDAVSSLFPVVPGSEGSVPLTYNWPGHSAPGSFVFISADRPHLKWETRLGAPSAWKMTLHPSNSTAETIPGDPSHVTSDEAEAELTLLASRGAGQPYLIAVKLRDEPTTLHLRAYLGDPGASYDWANINLVPTQIRDLAFRTTQSRALQWALFQSGGVVPAAHAESALGAVDASQDPVAAAAVLDEDHGKSLLAYLSSPGYGLFFDSSRNHDAWSVPTRLSERLAALAPDLIGVLSARFPQQDPDDAAAETGEIDDSEVESFRDQIIAKDFSVEDATATTKTRGSAQRAFADVVKTNYGWRCAITGISSKEFLVASHVVPWSQDRTIRLDPSNGICLSLLVDRAFEKGHLIVEDDLTIRINWGRVGNDASLRALMEPLDGTHVRQPTSNPPRPELLRRRRELVQDTV